jgi:hypothetical protein
MVRRPSKPSGGSLFKAGAHTTGRRVRERAMDGLEAFRVNRLRREADSNISDEWVRFIQPDSGACCVHDRAMDGLETFRINRLRREADLDLCDIRLGTRLTTHYHSPFDC